MASPYKPTPPVELKALQLVPALLANFGNNVPPPVTVGAPFLGYAVGGNAVYYFLF